MMFMPKITNPYYAAFVIQKAEREAKSTRTIVMDLIPQETFESWLDEIPNQKKPRGCSTAQARALLILIYYSGCRESEAVELMSQGITKVKEIVKGKPIYFYKVNIPALKGGLNEPIYLAINDYTTELYDYTRGLYPRERAFGSFYSNNTETIRSKKISELLIKNPNPDGTFTLSKEKYLETKTKQYQRHGKKVYNYVTLWTGRTPHYFRHHRFSLNKSNGWSNEEIMRFKRATSLKSIQPYIHINPEYLANLNKYRKE